MATFSKLESKLPPPFETFFWANWNISDNELVTYQVKKDSKLVKTSVYACIYFV